MVQRGQAALGRVIALTGRRNDGVALLLFNDVVLGPVRAHSRHGVVFEEERSAVSQFLCLVPMVPRHRLERMLYSLELVDDLEHKLYDGHFVHFLERQGPVRKPDRDRKNDSEPNKFTLTSD